MAARLSPKKLPRYSLEFKRKAVKLTQIRGWRCRPWRRPWISTR